MASVAPPIARTRRAALRRSHARRVRAWAAGRSTTALVGAAVLVLLGVSLALRTAALGAQFWVDEGISVGIASHPASQIPGLLGQDGSPPLYYLLLHLWIAGFGPGEAATHALSLLFATLAVPAALWAGWSLFGRRAGLICATLVALEPFLTWYAQETRMYSLLALESIVIAAAFVHAFVHGRRRYLPVFAVATALALWTHNWALFLLAAAGVAFLFCLARSADRRATLRDGVLAFGAIALLFAPWVPTLLYQAAHTGAPWSGRPTLRSLPRALYTLGGGPWPARVLLLTAAGGLAWALCRRADTESPTSGTPAAGGRWALGRRVAAGPGPEGSAVEWTAVVGLALLGFGTLIIAWAYARTSPDWTARYFAVIVGPLAIIASAGLARARLVGLAALGAVVGLWVAQPREHAIEHKSNVRRVAAELHGRVHPGDLVVSTQPEQVPVLRYYLSPALRYADPTGPVRDPRVFDWRNALGRLRAATPRRDLQPLLRRVPVGGQVVLVRPLRRPAGSWGPAVGHASGVWTDALTFDPRFVAVGAVGPRRGGWGTGVRAILYRRVRTGPAAPG